MIESDSVLNLDHVAGILVFLLHNEDPFATEIRQVMGNYERLSRILRQLERSGLVKITIEKKPRVSHKISLTEKGTKIAKKYEEIEAILMAQN
jgi:predicted transcriptional regulator